MGATSSTSWVQGKAGRLRVEEAGSGGVPAVLVHGNAGDRTHWAGILPHLALRRRTVAYDLRGMGESEAPTDGDYSLRAMVSDLESVADALGLPRFVLIGHSYGGSVVAAACGRIPERLAGAAFLDAAGDLRSFPAAELEAWRAGMGSDRFRETIQAWFAGLLGGARPSTRARVVATLERTPRAVYVGAMEGLLTFDPAAAIARFPGPKIFLAARDLDGPLSLQRAVGGVPFEFIEEVSHWLQLDRPEAVNAALDRFLAEVPS